MATLVPLAILTSEPSRIDGQDHRSSWADAEFRTLDNGSQFTLRVNGGASTLAFDLMQDVSGGNDPVVHSGVKNGSTVKLDMGKAYYIANPKDAQNLPFAVEFLASV